MAAQQLRPFDRIMIDRLEARQDELIEQLDALNARLEETLATCLPPPGQPSAQSPAVAACPSTEAESRPDNPSCNAGA